MNTCPLCLKNLHFEKRKADFMASYANYETYSCENCGYIVDFTVENDDIRASIVSSAFRHMAENLNILHQGGSIDFSRKEQYKRFVDSDEFKLHSDKWEYNNLSFWKRNKFLLLWIQS